MAHPMYKNLIGGEWKPAANGRTTLNLNPADHTDVVGEFPASQAEDVADAVAPQQKRPTLRGGWSPRPNGLKSF